ncbi:phosphoribosylanthranilate isomerase [Thiohalorhabdus methylotrophus]|uniref:N-(5'-phosphoribosyl)anthranilate isomerase n=1 Tax=Thiohalorhabdus methylotrophus TaxID=3242694 RepID=A0ABV4TW60_9GAMM
MGRTRVKICGITRPEDGRMAAAAGADAVGLVFHPDSPRAVTPERAAEIRAALPPFVTAVGLFVDPDRQQVAQTLAACPLDLLQFHGGESPGLCGAFDRPYIKAVRVGPDTDLGEAAQRYGADRLLLDAYVPGQAGGTGRTFRWSLIPAELASRVVLAGGLDADNVGEAVRAVGPYAVDASSGVEERPGVKSAVRVAAFIQGVRDADRG